MQNLRLVGIHEDGEHLLLADQDGTRFHLPLDDALRDAVRRERPRPAGATDDDDQEPMRPREVQGLIRTGVPLAEVAERAGWDPEKVRRYAPPIRAERDFVATRAQAIALRDRSGATTLGDRVAQRLADRGVDAERVGWDAWKETDSAWKVVCLFPAGGRERRASWRFSASDQTIVASDDEARWLGEDEHGSGPGAPTPTVPKSARNAAVYDVEAEGGVGAQVRPRGSTPQPTASEPVEQGATTDEESAVDLMSVMRERAASRRRRPKRRPTPTDTPIPPEEMPDDARPVEHLDLDSADEPPQGSHADPDDLDGERGSDDSTEPPDDTDGPDHDPVTGTRDLFGDLEAVSDSRATKQRGRKRSRRKAGPPLAEEKPEVPEEPPPADELMEVAPTDDDAVAEAEEAPDSDAASEVPEAPAAPENDAVPEPDEDDKPDEDDEAGTESRAPDVPSRQGSTRKGRPSVPSWDDIMFGSRRED